MERLLEAGLRRHKRAHCLQKFRLQPQKLVLDHLAMFCRSLDHFVLALCKKQSEAFFV